jgi:hypothetical protein
MKVHRPHSGPLPKQAIAIPKDLANSPAREGWRFSVRSTARSITEGTFNAAPRHLG